MKLLSKLTLFITFSKLLIVVLFVILLPFLVEYASFQYSNYYLGQQKKKVLQVIDQNGLDFYLQGDTAYASYTMLKEEYISLLPAGAVHVKDTIETAQRIVGADTLNYRILLHDLENDSSGHYVLEIGRTTATISQYNRLLQRFTLYVLIGLIVISIVVDLIYTNILLRPLGDIVSTKLLNRKFPFKETLLPVKTSTLDFKYLDSALINLMEKVHEAFDKEREFTSNASHELMTPISILQSNIENLMMAEGIGEDAQENISAMMKTLGRLKRIVHSLLYISRIENDQFAKADTVGLHELMEAVMEELAYRLEAENISFENRLEAGILITQVNRDLFFQLLYNLINNAIRYNKPNGIIRVSGSFEANKSFSLHITDTGIGIDNADLAGIFNRFKKSGQHHNEGYGLGLSIVKTITTFLGFEIGVTSVPGEGSVFSIIVPASLIQ